MNTNIRTINIEMYINVEKYPFCVVHKSRDYIVSFHENWDDAYNDANNRGEDYYCDDTNDALWDIQYHTNYLVVINGEKDIEYGYPKDWQEYIKIIEDNSESNNLFEFEHRNDYLKMKQIYK